MGLLTLDEARTALRIPASSTDQNAVIQGYIDAATPVIEDITGPIVAATIVQSFDGGRDHVVLSSPAASVTSVTCDGVAVSFVANLPGGVVYGGNANYPVAFRWGRQNVVVTYTVGSNTVPANVKTAAQEFVRWRWLESQQLNRNVPDEMGYTPSGYSVPRSVIELCAPNMRAPGIA